MDFWKELKERKKIGASLYLAIGYFCIIVIGAFLLATPFSRATFDWTWGGFWASWTNPLDAFFTSTSAACVTGLVTVPTGEYWSFFGQIVILLLIQLGGLGFMSIISLVILIFKRRINITYRKVAVQAAGLLEIGDVTSAIKRVIGYTVIFEASGAAILLIDFLPRFGAIGIYYSIFTSISAFCNAGFALFNDSLMSFSNNYLVLSVIMILIISGGLGFIVWENLFRSLFRWKKFKLQTKLVLFGSVIIIFVPALLFFLFELNGEAFEGFTFGQKIFNSLFQSVTCRTAGFNTFDQSKMTDSSLMLSNVLMLIGGNSGSTAGGVKLTTIMVLLLAILSATRKEGISVGKRRIDDNIVRQASSVFIFYLILLNLSLILIYAFESMFGNGIFTFRDSMFEVVSAIGTVGLSSGGTENLFIVSKILLIFLMYIGRTGGLTIIYILLERGNNDDGILKKPSEKVSIG